MNDTPKTPPSSDSEPDSAPDSAPVAEGSPPASPPPPTPRIGKLIAVVGLLVLVLAIGIVLGPSVQSFMESRSTATEGGEDSDDAEGTWYISQMHPWIIQPEPGQCPICGMDLTPIDPDRFAGEITIDPVIVQNIGVRIEPADVGPIEREMRVVGTVVLAENRVHDVVQRFDGWVEETMVGARFDRVEEGTPLFRIYAPDVFVAEREFLVVKESANAGDSALLAAARRRLQLIGISEKEITRLETTGVATDTVTVESPAAGVVWQKSVNPGSQIAARTVAYQIADLSTVWVEATVYEHQLKGVEVGQDAIVDLDHGGGPPLTGTVAAIYPTIDPMTRGALTRIVLANPDRRLKPGMFATVRIRDHGSEDVVRVPTRAIIGTGDRTVLFVSLGRGRFEPRTVEIGPQSRDGHTAILAGVSDGEAVVVSGQFLLDSESKMREALAKVMKGTLVSEQAPQRAVSSQTSAAPSVIGLDAASRAAFQSALADYLGLQKSLYRNDASAALPTALKVRTSFAHFIEVGKKGDPHFHHKIAAIPELTTTAAALGGLDLETLRVSFGELSVALREVILAVGAPPDPAGPWVGMRCGMADGIQDDGVWLQIGDDPRNPYFGDASGMRSCAMESWGVPDFEKTPAAKSEPGPDDAHQDDEGMSEPKSSPGAEAKGAISDQELDRVLSLTAALFRDDLPAAQEEARLLAAAIETAMIPGAPITDAPPRSIVLMKAHALVSAPDLDSARQALGEIGVALRDAARAGLLPEGDLRIYRCGMARGIAEKGIWLQRGSGEPANPFFGVEHGMSDCATGTWTVTASGLEEVTR